MTEPRSFVCSKCRNKIFTVETMFEGEKPSVVEDGWNQIRLVCSFCDARYVFDVKKNRLESAEAEQENVVEK